MAAEIQIWTLCVGLGWWPKVEGESWQHWLMSGYVYKDARIGAMKLLGFRLGYEW